MSLSACSLLLDTDAAGTDPPADGGGTSDGNTATDAATDATPTADSSADANAGPRMNSCGALLFGTEVPLINGDFELGCATGTTSYNALSVEATDPVSRGTIACRVCGTSTGSEAFSMGPEQSMTLSVGEVYELVACVRTAPGRAPAQNVRGHVASGGSGAYGPEQPLTESYAPLRTSWTVSGSEGTIRVWVVANQTVDTCLLVDDVRLFKVK